MADSPYIGLVKRHKVNHFKDNHQIIHALFKEV